MAELCDSNFIGNGSSALMRRSAILAAGGYESRLRDMRAEGCEDYLLYFRIAEQYEFRRVPEYLTGYRESAVSMSSDGVQMIKSYREVEREIITRHADLAPRVRALRAKIAVWLLHRSVQARNWGGVGYLVLQITAVDPTWAPIAIYKWAKAKAKRALAPALKPPAKPITPTTRFEIGSPVADPKAVGSV
jgi:hypothetical protein